MSNETFTLKPTNDPHVWDKAEPIKFERIGENTMRILISSGQVIAGHYYPAIVNEVDLRAARVIWKQWTDRGWTQ